MKTLLTALLFASFGSQAFDLNKDITFVAANDTKDTNVCLVALKEGFNAAEKYIGLRGESALEITSCNGLSVYNFVKKYQAGDNQSKKATEGVIEKVEQVNVVKVVKYVPANQKSESQLCALAAQEGLDAAVAVGGERVLSFYCNGKHIERFVR